MIHFNKSFRRWVLIVIAFISSFGLVIAAATPSPAIPWAELLLRSIQVIQLANLSDQQEVSIGQQINNQIIQQYKIVTDSALVNYVDEIGRRLVAQSDRPRLPFKFQVVADKNVNAFATMGGFVYVHTGLMKAADNEAQLASVIGHEIGHITGKHLANQLRQMSIIEGIATIAGVNRDRLVRVGVEYALRRPRSRQDELDADNRGLRMLTQSGYAPSAMPAFMQKLVSSASLPTFLSTHPAAPERVALLNQSIDPSRANVGAGLDGTAYKSRISSIP